MVHLVGLEPTSLAALEPESSVCANFTTGANEEIVYQKPLRAVNPPSDAIRYSKNPGMRLHFVAPQAWILKY